MSVHKNLAELLKVCSVLPVLAVMPAMADMPTPVNNTVSGANVSGNTSGGYNLKSLNTDLTIQNSVFTNNSSSGNGTVAWATARHDLEVKKSEFTGNVAAGIAGVIGGGTEAGMVTVSGSKFTNNHAVYDGGAIAAYAGLSISDSVFDGNTAQYDANDKGEYNVPVVDSTPLGGGALALGAVSNTTIAAIDSTTFKNNVSGTNGGAIATRLAQNSDGSKNSNTAKLDVAATFENNSALKSGGAIYNTFYSDNGMGKGNGVTVTGVFKNNTAGDKGGAIYNDGTLDKNGKGGVMTITDATFSENTAASAGAIYNTGALNIIGATFENNSAKSSAGAIQNSGENSLIYVEDTEFIGNKSGGSFGAMVSGTATQSTIIKDSEFKNNSALDVGALGLYSDATLSDVDFIENKALSAQNGYDGAGAVFLGAESKIVMDDVDFIRNTSALRGGAISTRSADLANNSAARLDILNSTFVGNTAETTGGAFDNYLYSSKTDATAVYMQTVQFTGNSATQGGAIYNHGDADKAGNVASMRLNNVTFVGNQATDTGGAIYNEAGAGITFQGINTFAKNTAAKKPNDIYNDGLINIESGTTSMAAGVVGNGTFTISKDATLNLVTGMISQDIINIDGTINASVLNPEGSKGSKGSYAKIFADKELNIGDSAKLNLTVGSVGTYNIFDGRMSGIDIEVGDTYKVSETQDGIVVAIKPVEELAQDTGLNTDTAAVVIGLATTSSPTAQRVSLAAQKALKRGDTVQVEQELAKLNPDDKPVAQSVSTSVQSQVMTLATNRMSGATGTIGRAGGDNANDVSGVWAQGLFNKSKLADQFHGYTRGFAIGADTTIGKDWLLGAGFAYNDSDVHASGRRTDIDGKTLFVYGQYKPTNWFVNGTLAYTMSEYTESVNPFGEYITSDYDVDTYGAQLMTGYDMAYGFTPSIGLRYMHVAQDAYTNTVNSFDSVDTDYLTGVAGLKYAFTIQTNNALKFSPEFRAALTYDFINDDVNTNVVIPGGMGSYQIAAERLSEFGGEFGIGLNMQYRGIDLSLVYDLAIHQDYTSQTGMIKLRSQF